MENFDRKKSIGCSEIAVCMGLSRYKTPLQLWAEKTGKLEPKDLSDVEAVQLGSELEDFVARKFERKTGMKVRRDARTFRHPKYDYITGHIDRLVLDGRAILECKTTSAWNARQWEGEDIPQEYIIQLMGYLGLTKRKEGYIACLIGGQKFVWKQIQFDQELFDKMIVAVRIFWEEYVLKNVPPLAIGGDEETLALLFSEVKNDLLTLSSEQETVLNGLIEERQGGIEQKKLIEEELSRIENRIKQMLGESEQAVTGQYAVTWKKQARQSVDTEKLKAAGLFEQYSKLSEFRVLRTKILRGLK